MPHWHPHPSHPSSPPQKKGPAVNGRWIPLGLVVHKPHRPCSLRRVIDSDFSMMSGLAYICTTVKLSWSYFLGEYMFPNDVTNEYNVDLADWPLSLDLRSQHLGVNWLVGHQIYEYSWDLYNFKYFKYIYIYIYINIYQSFNQKCMWHEQKNLQHPSNTILAC